MQNVVTYDVVVGVDNSDLALVPGMTASTEIVTDQRDNVLRVPDQALRYSPGGLADRARSAPTRDSSASGCCATASRSRFPS